jgi:hypothetical protein
VPTRPIFRESAVEAHRRRAGKDVVPRLASRPVTVAMWALIATLAGAAVVAWSVRVPTYVPAAGVVLGHRTAVVFAAPDDLARMRVGGPVQVQIGSAGTHVRGALARTVPGVIGPDAARKRYGLSVAPDLVTEPVSVAIVRLGARLPATYRGSRLSAQMKTGSERLLELFPGLAKVVGSGA